MKFTRALEHYKNTGRVPVIPDLKRRSPKEGELFAGRNPLDLAKALSEAGAPVLSVVTEQESFGGSMDLLREAVSLGLPVLRKDFIKTAGEIEASAEAGAAAVLLIAAMLGEEELEKLLDASAACLLDALVEVHTLQELDAVNRFSPKLVGINNRDILRLEKDDGTVETTAEIAAAAKRPALLISESAIESAGDVRRAIRAGADAVLVGTALLKAGDIKGKYAELSVTLL